MNISVNYLVNITNELFVNVNVNAHANAVRLRRYHFTLLT